MFSATLYWFEIFKYFLQRIIIQLKTFVFNQYTILLSFFFRFFFFFNLPRYFFIFALTFLRIFFSNIIIIRVFGSNSKIYYVPLFYFYEKLWTVPHPPYNKFRMLQHQCFNGISLEFCNKLTFRLNRCIQHQTLWNMLLFDDVNKTKNSQHVRNNEKNWVCRVAFAKQWSEQ